MKPRYQFIWVLILFCILGIGIENANATRMVRMFNSPDMLSSSYNGMTRDSNGFLWVGINRGVMLFDGNMSIYFRNIPNDSTSLSDNRVLHVLSDSQGRVWVGTANGLNLYDSGTDTFRRVNIPDMNYGGYILKVIEQSDKTITFIISGRGLYVVDETNDQLVGVRYMAYTPEEKDYTTVVEAPNGRLYAGTQSGHIISIGKNGSIKTIPVTNGYISDIAVEADGNILVSSAGDLFRLNTKTGNVESVELPVTNKNWIHGIKASPDGKVYMTMSDIGIMELSPKETKAKLFEPTYSPVIDLSKSRFSSLYCDREGNIWVACNYAGIAMIPKTTTPFAYFGLSNALEGFKGGIDAMAVAGDKIYVAYSGGSIGKISIGNGEITRFKLPTTNTITSIAPYTAGTILVGVSNEGVWQMDCNTGAIVSKVIDMPGKYLRIPICVTPDGRIFASLHGIGLYLYDPATKKLRRFEHNSQQGKLTNPFVTEMRMSDDNKVWIGLYGGLSCYDLKSGQFLDINQEPFIQGATYSVAPLKDGTVLAGTSHGLIHYHPTQGVLRTYTTDDGLTDIDIRTIDIDRKGGKWIGTMKGLSHMAPNSSKIDSYYGGYGLFENTFRFSAHYANDDKMVFASDLGLTVFNPIKVPAPGFNSDVKVASVLLNGTRLAPFATSGRQSFVDNGDEEPLTLYLPYEDNAMTLVLSTLDFRDAANVRYLWKFKGDKEWSTTQPGVSELHLPHLDPGTNTLIIKAVDGNVESKEKMVKIKVQAPWYMSGLAYTLYAVIFLALILMVYLVVKKKREAQVADDRIKLFIDITHDIRSPITLILNPLKSLLNNSKDPDEHQKLHTIYRNANRVLSLVNQMLYLRRLDNGKMPLCCRETNISAFVGELVEMFKPQAADKKIKLDFKYEGGLRDKIWVDRDNLDKILVNLISNAIKYTNNGGEIQVILSKDEDKDLGNCVKIDVIDNGIGLDPKVEAKIFERFYRADVHNHDKEGFGIGLDLCRRLVSLHHGKIQARNRNDKVKGSVFTILLPLDANMYNSDEFIEGEDETALVGQSEGLEFGGRAAVVKPDVTIAKPRRQSSGSKRLLVVDDDKELRDYIRSHFAKSHKVDVAADGAEGLRMVTQKNYDLVITDIKMPNMDGFTLLRNIKKNVSTSHIPVIMLSSKNELADRVEGWDRGADGYLGKPFHIDELDIMATSLIDSRLRLKGKYSGAQSVDEKITMPEVKGFNESLMEKVIKIVNEHLDDPELNVEKLGQEVGISRAHLHRKLKDIIGMTPSDFIRNVRLKRACELLKKPDVEITQVAYTIGFTSQPHFSTAFKRYTGYSPSEYRTRCLNGENIEITDRA